MNRNSVVMVLSLLCCLALASCSDSGQRAANAPANSAAGKNENTPKIPPAEIVRAEAAPVEIKAGGTGSAEVTLTIAEGFHVNANPPTLAYLIPTELTIEASDGVTAEKPVYPASITKKFAFADQALAVYEGRATIKLPLRVAATASRGARALKAKVRVQPCDDQACYPPRMIDTSIPLTVK